MHMVHQSKWHSSIVLMCLNSHSTGCAMFFNHFLFPLSFSCALSLSLSFSLWSSAAHNKFICSQYLDLQQSQLPHAEWALNKMVARLLHLFSLHPQRFFYVPLFKNHSFCWVHYHKLHTAAAAAHSCQLLFSLLLYFSTICWVKLTSDRSNIAITDSFLKYTCVLGRKTLG